MGRVSGNKEAAPASGLARVIVADPEIIWQGPAKTIDDSGNPYVEQFIHGSAEGPIQMDVLKP